MRFPKHHIADQVVGRILAASRALQGLKPLELPDDEPLSEQVIPPDISSGFAGQKQALADMQPQQTQPTQQTQPELPPLNESGLDIGAVLSGRDTIDAMLNPKG